MNILKKDCNLIDAKDKSLPINSYLVTYIFEEKKTYDIVQSSGIVEVFDHYYDEYGKGALQKIKWTDGRVNPKVYGYTPKETKKRK